MFLTVGSLYAQSDSTTNKVKVNSPKKEEENLNVFQQWITWNNPGSLMMNHLTRQALRYYKIRDEEIAKLKTRSDWQKRQQAVRDKLKVIFGTIPKKGALNPEITGIVQKEGYRIEKIIYECTPGYYVTGCLYIPGNINGKAPAILYLIGHDQPAFREQYYQVIITNLVKKGMIVFAIDPPGQGEHVQYYDPKVKFSAIGYTVIEHCYFGNQCLLSGVSPGKYFIWEGVRAIDYLLTRKEVDPEKIGLTGFSGGGTITSYIAALDERVKVSAPCSWATASRRHIETKGAFDSESILVGGVAQGITFEDLLEVRSPNPTLMTITSRDEYLSMQGARDALREAKKTYRAFGAEDHLELVEDDFKHGMTPKIRLAIYAFFLKHFNMLSNPAEEQTDLPTAKELTVTPTGQIVTSKGGKMIFDLNKKESEKLLENLDQSRRNIAKHLSKVKVKAKEISGYATPSRDKEGSFINGRYQRDGYTVQLDAIAGESGDYAIPVLLFKPDDKMVKHPAVVYLHPEGKATDAQSGGEIEKLVRKGYIVAATDVLGVGETKHTAGRGLMDGYIAVLIGRSIVGIQAGDIVRVVNYLKDRNDVDPGKIGAIGIGGMCLPLMHAAAFDSSINNITLIGSPISYRSIVLNRIYKIGVTKHEGGGIEHPYEIDFSWGIAGVLTAYDLPDLIASMAPRKVILAELKDQLLEPASEALINEEMEFPRAAYDFNKASANIKVVSSSGNLTSLVDWCFSK